MAKKGEKLSEETKQKLRLANLGKKHSEETIRKMSGKTPWNKGKKGIVKQSKETIQKRIKKTTGQKRTTEQKERMSKAQKGLGLGRKQSPETIRKRSASLIGHEVNEETREKIRIGNLGKKRSKETRKKISVAGKGRKQSEEEKKKRADSNRGKKRSKEFSEALSKRMKGKKVSDETRKKQSKIRKVISNRPEVKQKQRELRATQVFPNKDTKPELAVQKILTDNQITFQKHIPIKIGNRFHQVDVLLDDKKIIEVNGTYHHADPRKYEPNKIITLHRKQITAKQVWTEEKTKLDKIRNLGYQILIVWQIDIEKNMTKTQEDILNFINS